MLRVRFAPSPTGFLHLGGLRTALYNFLLARKNKGKFILRIEDTDTKREKPEAIKKLIETLNQMGLLYDEGVFFDEKNSEKITEKGEYGPYVQSKRLAIYQKFVFQLINQGDAYYCFCSEEDLEQSRKKQIADGKAAAYDRCCRKLNQEEVEKKLKQKIPYVVRLKVPETGKIEFNDLIRKKVKFDLKNIDDQVLLKSDGYPTYHLAVVVDDHLMEITHVIRGEEWIPSVPKHILIYQALGWPLPLFAHLPLLLNPDGSKLSKRQGDVMVEDYLSAGYLPEALINFITLLGWSAQSQFISKDEVDSEQEIFSLKKLIDIFSIEKIQKAGAIFNLQKLDWMNGYYIRKMSVDELTTKSLPFLIQAGLIHPVIRTTDVLTDRTNLKFSARDEPITGWQITQTGEEIDFYWLKKVIALEQERIKKLSDLPLAVELFFKDKIDYPSQILVWKKTTVDKTKENLKIIKEELIKIQEKEFISENIQKYLQRLAEKQGNGDIFWPLRVALSGRQASPPPAEIAEILGKKKSLARITLAIIKLKNN